ncbi:histone-lysine N-methyltransferase SETMAR [Trichonephila clavipes]|nr:histone-lysine N-methyltransferase SETMAR [Trichonephila clavipes]
MELAREHYRAMIFSDFKAGLNKKECFQWLQLAFDDESPWCATVFRWLKKFCSGRSSLQDEDNTRRPTIPDNVCHTKNVNG